MTAIGLITVLLIGILVFYKLTNTALHNKANVRAGARLGPGSFFLEVTDQKPAPPESRPKK